LRYWPQDRQDENAKRGHGTRGVRERDHEEAGGDWLARQESDTGSVRAGQLTSAGQGTQAERAVRPGCPLDWPRGSDQHPAPNKEEGVDHPWEGAGRFYKG
jgi:hypothetical protein